jgi:hypothetical protein
MQVSSPVTAAGPCRILTGFPVIPHGDPSASSLYHEKIIFPVKEKNAPLTLSLG